MHFTYVGNYNQAHSTEGYITTALEAEGHEVARVQETSCYPEALLSRLSSRYGSIDPQHNVLLFSKCELPGCEFSRGRCADPSGLATFLQEARKVATVVCWGFDLLRAEFSSGRYHWAKTIAPLCHLFLSTDAGLDVPGAKLLRQGYPGATSLPVNLPAPSYKVGFFGVPYGERRGWHEALRREFGVGYLHISAGVYNVDLFRWLRSCRIVVGPPWPYYPGYWSNRLYVTTGYGGCYACPAVFGMQDEGWEAGTHYLPLTTRPSQVIEQLRAYCDVRQERLDEVAAAGRALCLAEHTYTHRVRQLVRMIQSVQ